MIEGWFRDKKVYFGLEAFRCRSHALIAQDIYSLLDWITVCTIVERDAYRRIELSCIRQNPSEPHRFQISHSISTGSLRTSSPACCVLRTSPLPWPSQSSTCDGSTRRLADDALIARIPEPEKHATGGEMLNLGPVGLPVHPA